MPKGVVKVVWLASAGATAALWALSYANLARTGTALESSVRVEVLALRRGGVSWTRVHPDTAAAAGWSCAGYQGLASDWLPAVRLGADAQVRMPLWVPLLLLIALGWPRRTARSLAGLVLAGSVAGMMVSIVGAGVHWIEALPLRSIGTLHTLAIRDGAVLVSWTPTAIDESGAAWDSGRTLAMPLSWRWIPRVQSTPAGSGRVIVPLWLTAALAVGLWWALGIRRAESQRNPGACHRCHYDLRGAPGPCPECGLPVTRSNPGGI